MLFEYFTTLHTYIQCNSLLVGNGYIGQKCTIQTDRQNIVCSVNACRTKDSYGADDGCLRSFHVSVMHNNFIYEMLNYPHMTKATRKLPRRFSTTMYTYSAFNCTQRSIIQTDTMCPNAFNGGWYTHDVQYRNASRFIHSKNANVLWLSCSAESNWSGTSLHKNARYHQTYYTTTVALLHSK